MFDADHYEVRQKISIGNKYNIYEGDGEDPILASAQKKFRLKEDFRFLDPESDEERFRVKADSVLDVAAAYDIEDSTTGERVGSVRRSVKSMVKHEYELLDADGDVVGVVKEDSVANAIIRRFVTTLVPFSYVIEGPTGEHLGEVNGAFSLRDRYSIDLSSDLDPRLAVIATVVIDAIEAN
jgi:uncharacterized protein YxjI